MKIARPDIDDDGGFDLTPMIDVVFLLIAFFMVVASMVTDELFKIEMPLAETATVPEDRSNRQNITVSAGGKIFYGAKELSSPDDIVPILSSFRQSNAQIKVYLRADAGAEHRHVQAVMAACAASGVLDVIFSTNQK